MRTHVGPIWKRPCKSRRGHPSVATPSLCSSSGRHKTQSQPPLPVATATCHYMSRLFRHVQFYSVKAAFLLPPRPLLWFESWIRGELAGRSSLFKRWLRFDLRSAWYFFSLNKSQGFKERKWRWRRDTTGSRGRVGIREPALTTGSTQLMVSCKSRAFSAGSHRCRHGIVGEGGSIVCLNCAHPFNLVGLVWFWDLRGADGVDVTSIHFI